VEFHCHTCYSPDSLVKPGDLIQRARELGLDRVVVTDHNSIQGARAARELAPDLVIVGEEVSTTHGELIGFFVEEEVPAGLSPDEALARLRDQGAVVGIPHPFDTLRGSALGPEHARRLAPMVDALEVFNARCHRATCNEAAEELARAHGLGRFAGSDAHSLWELGRAVTILPPFSDATSLRAALHEASIRGLVSPPWVHGISTMSKVLNTLGLGPCG